MYNSTDKFGCDNCKQRPNCDLPVGYISPGKNICSLWIGIASGNFEAPITESPGNVGEFKINRDKVVKELAEVLNRNCVENESNTADFILAEYLYDCLEAYKKIHDRNEKWYGKELKIGNF